MNSRPGTEEEWITDAQDSGDEGEADLARLRITAVRLLGYTHTEYGLRDFARITAELETVAPKQRTKNDIGDLYDDEEDDE